MDVDRKWLETRDSILLATLAQVPFEGWSARALRAGVGAAGLTPDMALRAFPDGMIDLVGHFSDWADRQMLSAIADEDLSAMRVRERVALGVRRRLEALAPYREAVRRVLSFMALPQNAGLALRGTWRTVDAIWYAAGDTATDFNHYTKRGLLASVHASSVLYWLGDDSEGFADTWAYLDRRIEGILAVPRLQSRLKKAITALPRPSRFFRTAS